MNSLASGFALDPKGLFSWLANLPVGHQTCVECGAGLGEVTSFLSSRFQNAVATDAAPPRSANTTPGSPPIIRATAESIPFENHSVDLLFSMQSLHHFNLNSHLTEARRILRPGGVFAALAWGTMILPPALRQPYAATFRSLSPFWERSREWVISGYAGLGFPGTSIAIPRAQLTRQLTLHTLDTHIAGWTATQSALQQSAHIAEPKTEKLNQTHLFSVTWPIVGRAWRTYS